MAGRAVRSPATYTSSVIDELKDQKLRSVGLCDYMKNATIDFYNRVSGLVSTTVIFLLLWLTWGLALPITGISIGTTYIHDCPAERHIPIYIIVYGCFSVFLGFFCLIDKFRKRNDAINERKPMIMPALTVLFALFLFAWFIAGNVWVFRMVPCQNNSSRKYCYTLDEAHISGGRYCNYVVFKFTYWLIIATWGMAALVAVAFVIFAALMLGVYYCSDQGQPRAPPRR